jgi:hypothetical protein
MYEQIAFVHETRSGARTHLEWERRFAGQDIAGATILAHNAQGMIENIRLYHRPYEQVISFSENSPVGSQGRSTHRTSRTGSPCKTKLIEFDN